MRDATEHLPRAVVARMARALAAGLAFGLVTAVPQLHAQAKGSHGFSSPQSVEGTVATGSSGLELEELKSAKARRQLWEERHGLSFGIDNNTLYLGSTSDQSPSDGFGNALRLYGAWTAVGRGKSSEGALIFKGEYRSAFAHKLSPQALGPSLGYAGLLSTTFSDAGLILSNLYWRQRFADGRGTFVVGQVDVTDYVDVNSLANPWAAFANLAFQQPPTLPAPSQGVGAAALWRLDDHWALLGGIADANANPADPLGSAETLFDTGETFKHLALGWTPDWEDRYDRMIQLTVWQIDERSEAGVEDGVGLAFTASTKVAQWSTFLRLGFAEDGGALLDRTVSLGAGYDARGERDLAGLGIAWGNAPGSTRDQVTLEAFYRFDPLMALQVTPSVQYVANPAHQPAEDGFFVVGMRVRLGF